MFESHPTPAGGAGHAETVPATTLNVNVMEPEARPENNTRPLQATLVEIGWSVQLLESKTNELASTLAEALPTWINRLSQLVIVAVTR